MATVIEYLKELGYSDEDANQLASDPKVSKPIEQALAVRDEGLQYKTQAEQQKAELDKWWKETAQPAILNADGGSAAAKAEAARYKAYMQTFIDQGYPVSDDIKNDLKGQTPVATTTPANTTPSFDPDKYQRQLANDTADNMVRVYALGEEYRELFGGRLPDPEGLLNEARQNNKPLREYVYSKFNFEGKKQEIAEKKIQDRIAAAVKEKEDALNAKMAERHNPLLAPAISSRAAQVREQFKDAADSWKTKVGRTEAKAERILKFRDVAQKTA